MITENRYHDILNEIATNVNKLDNKKPHLSNMTSEVNFGFTPFFQGHLQHKRQGCGAVFSFVPPLTVQPAAAA